MLKKYVCTHIAYPSPPLPTEHFWCRRVQYWKRKPSVYIYKQDKVQIAAIQTSLLWPSTDLSYKGRGASFLTVAGDSRLEEKISTGKCPRKVFRVNFSKGRAIHTPPGAGGLVAVARRVDAAVPTLAGYTRHLELVRLVAFARVSRNQEMSYVYFC